MTRFPLRLRRALAALALTLGLSLGLSVGLPLATAPARAADVALPPVDQVFVLSARATAPDRIEVQWTIADGYYLYRHRTAVTADPGFGQTRLLLPEGAKHHDEFFGDVQTYRRRLVAVLEGHPTPGTRSATLTVKYQGCADAGVCYPPQTRTLQVALPAAGPAPSAAAGEDGFGLAPRRAGGLFAAATGAAAEALPLPPEQAFASEVIARDGHTLLLRLTPAAGYYLYRDKLSVRLDGAPGASVTLPPAGRLPPARAHRDEHFGDVAVYFDQVELPLPLARRNPGAATATLVLGLQGCQDGGICYPPMTRRLAVDLPAAPAVPAAAEAVPAQAAPAADAPPAAVAAPPPAAAMPAAAAITTAGEARTPLPAATAPAAGRGGLWLALLLALLGGVILNLMPCVLPVLTLKALGLAQSGESRARARRHALAYTAGVLLSFATLGALALGLRRAGMALGWGFQLQQPLVVAVLGLVIFAFGLNLSGVWQFGLAVGGRAGALTRREGPAGDFFTGVLAVVLATPCTAPFMGSALAYAFTGPWLGGLLVFLALGLGLALPFLLVGFVPALAARLPRPGPWMEHFKQLLAFPLYATAAWLLYVLAALRGAEAVWHFALAAVALALALWAWNRAGAEATRGWRLLAIAAALALAWPLANVHRLPKPAARTAAVQPEGPPRVAWSEQALADLRRQGRVVFVNMTADWCVSCKANEKAVFAREDFGRWLEAADAVYMVGDYTDVDPAITAYLERHGAVGVPLYVVYPRGGGEGRVLPVILTPERVRAALAAAARGGR